MTFQIEDSRKTVKQQTRARELYYITHVKNLPSILANGILSHELVEKKGIKYEPIYDAGIVSRRKATAAPDGNSLWHFANLYFKARNPMLFRVKCEKGLFDVAIIGVAPEILNRQDIYVSTGNAAHTESEIVSPSQRVISQILKDIDREYWTEADGSKRKIMAECLVPNVVSPEHIVAVYVADFKLLDKIKGALGAINSRVPIIYEPDMFFKPSMVRALTKKLFLAEGDMFFSGMQTITISVNTVGVMGKGVASRAKYQFPDVYVNYQDFCRKHQLKMGKPVLFKREGSTDYQLADEPSDNLRCNSSTWFLLFPTKRHWRDNADIYGIEAGLTWLVENYKKDGIKSLALPALGCGLGRLEWKDVGPLLCRYLSPMDIVVYIYLPTEKEIPEKFLSKEYLLRQV